MDMIIKVNLFPFDPQAKFRGHVGSQKYIMNAVQIEGKAIGLASEKCFPTFYVYAYAKVGLIEVPKKFEVFLSGPASFIYLIFQCLGLFISKAS